jgi:hypothetical protein
MPYVIEVPIREARSAGGLVSVRAEVVLTVIGSDGLEASRAFRFDTGCGATTIDEEVATALGIPTGVGRPLDVHGSTGTAGGRVVAVTYRFPDEADFHSDGDVTRPGLTVADAEWVVVPLPQRRPGAPKRNIALLGFRDVHLRFAVWTTPHDLFLCRWSEVEEE